MGNVSSFKYSILTVSAEQNLTFKPSIKSSVNNHVCNRKWEYGVISSRPNHVEATQNKKEKSFFKTRGASWNGNGDEDDEAMRRYAQILSPPELICLFVSPGKLIGASDTEPVCLTTDRRVFSELR